MADIQVRYMYVFYGLLYLHPTWFWSLRDTVLIQTEKSKPWLLLSWQLYNRPFVMLRKISHKPSHVPVSPRQRFGLSKLPFRHTHRYSTTTIQGQALSTLGRRYRRAAEKETIRLLWIHGAISQVGCVTWIISYDPHRIRYNQFWMVLEVLNQPELGCRYRLRCCRSSTYLLLNCWSYSAL